MNKIKGNLYFLFGVVVIVFLLFHNFIVFGGAQCDAACTGLGYTNARCGGTAPREECGGTSCSTWPCVGSNAIRDWIDTGSTYDCSVGGHCWCYKEAPCSSRNGWYCKASSGNDYTACNGTGALCTYCEYYQFNICGITNSGLQTCDCLCEGCTVTGSGGSCSYSVYCAGYITSPRTCISYGTKYINCVCNSACGSDSACSGKTTGSSCGTGCTCSSNCVCTCTTTTTTTTTTSTTTTGSSTTTTTSSPTTTVTTTTVTTTTVPPTNEALYVGDNFAGSCPNIMCGGTYGECTSFAYGTRVYALYKYTSSCTTIPWSWIWFVWNVDADCNPATSDWTFVGQYQESNPGYTWTYSYYDGLPPGYYRVDFAGNVWLYKYFRIGVCPTTTTTTTTSTTTTTTSTTTTTTIPCTDNAGSGACSTVAVTCTDSWGSHTSYCYSNSSGWKDWLGRYKCSGGNCSWSPCNCKDLGTNYECKESDNKCTLMPTTTTTTTTTTTIPSTTTTTTTTIPTTTTTSSTTTTTKATTTTTSSTTTSSTTTTTTSTTTTTLAPGALSISFIPPTPADGTTTDVKSAYINTSATSTENTSSFIDWNRSLVGYWDLNENTGTTANDKSGYSNNGILFNFNWNSQSNWTTGKFGTGLKFDGTNDYVSIPDSANLDISSNITIEAWFKATSTGDYQIILMKGGHWNGDPVPPVYGLRLTDTNKFSCLIRIGGTEYANDTTATYTDNNWHHGALTYNGSNVKCYIDGVNYATLSVTGTIDTNNANVTIGLPRNLVDDRFSGTIDEVLIYKRVLSPEEIKAAYNTKINPLYNNFINLVIGAYTYYAYITDLTGANAQTETRTLTIATTTTTTTTTIMPCSGICTLQGSYCCYNGKLYRCQ